MSNAEITPLARLEALSVAEARCDCTYPGGTIGVISADLMRYARFTASLCGVKYPYGTDMILRSGCDVVHNCNQLVQDFTGDWLWIMGDDHVFDSNLLIRLLARLYEDDRDMVVPLCLGRQAPFPTVAGELDPATRRVRTLRLAEVAGQYRPVDVVGSAGLLIRRRVFERMAVPHFEAGSLARTGLGEDWWFCIKARDVGCTVWLDGRLSLGHMTSLVVWPHQVASGEVGAQLELDGRQAIFLQQTTPLHEIAA